MGMTQITDRPAATTSTSARLLKETEKLIRSLHGTTIEESVDLLGQLSLLLSDPEVNRPSTIALFHRNNSSGRDTLGHLFYGSREDDSEETGPVAPVGSRVANAAYRLALDLVRDSLNKLIPAENAPLSVKRDFWEDVKTNLKSGDRIDDSQAQEVTAADLNTVLKELYGRATARKLTAYTDSPESLNYVLFAPVTTEGTKLEIRASFKLNGELPPAGVVSLRTLHGVVHLI